MCGGEGGGDGSGCGGVRVGGWCMLVVVVGALVVAV